MLKCFHSRDRNLQIGLFRPNTFVRPVLEFNSPIWSPHLEKDIKAIERVQKYFTKNALCLRNLSYHVLLCVLKQPSLALRRVRADLIFLYKILHGLVDTDLKSLFFMNTEVVDSHYLRGHALKLNLPKPRTDVMKFSFAYRVVKLWNSVPSSVSESNSLTIFKQRLTTHLYLATLSLLLLKCCSLKCMCLEIVRLYMAYACTLLSFSMYDVLYFEIHD